MRGQYAVLLVCATAIFAGGCGDEGSAGPDAGYSIDDIVANPTEVVGKEVVVSGEVGDVFRPHALTLESEGGEAVLVVGEDLVRVAEGAVARAIGRVVETPFGRGEVPADIAAFLGDVTEHGYRHAIVATEIQILDGPNEF